LRTVAFQDFITEFYLASIFSHFIIEIYIIIYTLFIFEKQTLVQNVSMAYFTAKTKLSGHRRAKGASSNKSGALKFDEDSEVRVFRVSGDDLTLEQKPNILGVSYDTYLEILVDITNNLVHLHYCVVAYGS